MIWRCWAIVRRGEAPLPHVFFDKEDIVHSPLCLFDPAEGQWNHNMLIAHTTIPWVVDWLACYECWGATGRWYGGGAGARNQRYLPGPRCMLPLAGEEQ